MKHLWDITKIDGHSVPFVDCIIGGSPCQDLSIGGLRKGIQHGAIGDEQTTRSGLFIEQVRIVKEMREEDERRRSSAGADEYIRLHPNRPCRFLVWENVAGATNSNGGNDFRIVLEELARVSEEAVTIPLPPKGKWSNSGCIIGNGWSIAWRIIDAQYFVPQRRRRICLVADFDGYSAQEIVFDKQHGSTEQSEENETPGKTGQKCGREIQPIEKGCERNIGQGEQEEKETSTDFGRSIDANSQFRLMCDNQQYGAYSIDMGGGKSACHIYKEQSPTLCTTHYVEPAIGYVDGKEYYDVEIEVEKRKYEVDSEKLKKVLKTHKGSLTNQFISEKLGKPITLVEHWFRQDKYFSIPDAEIWFELKKLLGIDTNEFDKAITTYETSAGNFDMRNRIYCGGLAPTLRCGCGNNPYVLPNDFSAYMNKPEDGVEKMKTYTEKRFFEWHEDDTAVTLRSRSGSYGGGSEVFIVQIRFAPCVPPIIKDSAFKECRTENG